jgi:adenosylmethionine-8-amino-7-oxononanoate aminotransferase
MVVSETLQRDHKALDQRHIVHPHAIIGRPRPPLVMVRGENARIWDSDGNEYIDGTAGLWLCNVGHGRAELAEVARRQMEQLECYASFWAFSNVPSIELASRLAELAPPGLEHVFFTNGGSEGIDTAVKLARLAWNAHGQPDRNIVLSRRGAYHGSSWLGTAATGIEPLREGYLPLPGGFVHLTPPTSATTTDVLIAELEERIEEIGAERIAAFIGEPVMGVGGVLVPSEDYWPRVEAVLRKHGILFILDEVITGYGRTGTWFAAEHWGGLSPDLLVTAKGITSGYFPLGAVLIGPRVLSSLEGQAFRHGFTYNGHPAGCAVALANLAIIEREGLLERSTALARRLGEGLLELEDRHSAVVEARSFGLLGGLDIDVEDEQGFADAIFRAGLIVRVLAGKLVLSPPLSTPDDDLERLLSTLDDAFSGVSVS